MRTRIAPTFASAAYGVKPVREMIFRILSQTTISYHDSPLSSGVAGRVHGGDRLPWVVRGEVDNYAPPAGSTGRCTSTARSTPTCAPGATATA